MGKVAQLAHHVIVTSINRAPKIGKNYFGYCRWHGSAPTTIEDRAATILYAVKHAGVNDVILFGG